MLHFLPGVLHCRGALTRIQSSAKGALQLQATKFAKESAYSAMLLTKSSKALLAHAVLRWRCSDCVWSTCIAQYHHAHACCVLVSHLG